MTPHVYRTLLVAFLSAASALGQSASPAERMIVFRYPNSELSDVLHVYASLTHRKVWVELGLSQKVSVFSQRPVPLSDGLSLLRGSLLQAGIEIREVGETEAFVSRVTDPAILGLRLPSPSPSGSPSRPIIRKFPQSVATPTP